MARSTSLPERLRYLQPFRKKFTSRPDELNEETAEAPLFALFNKRLKGLSNFDAGKLLEEDLSALEAWLALSKNKNDCLQFVRGCLLVSPAELAERILDESAKAATPPPCVEIDLPDEVKTKRIGNRSEVALILKWKGLMVSFDAVNEDSAGLGLKALSRDDLASDLAVSSVQYGKVEGTKFVRTGKAAPFMKFVSYLLTVPGGHVQIAAAAVGKKIGVAKWDESIVEAFFHSLRVVQKSGAN